MSHRRTPQMDDFISNQRAILEEMKKSLSSLKSGEGNLWEGRVGGGLVDITSRVIEQQEQAIGEIEVLIGDYEAGTNA